MNPTILDDDTEYLEWAIELPVCVVYYDDATGRRCEHWCESYAVAAGYSNWLAEAGIPCLIISE